MADDERSQGQAGRQTQDRPRKAVERPLRNGKLDQSATRQAKRAQDRQPRAPLLRKQHGKVGHHRGRRERDDDPKRGHEWPRRGVLQGGSIQHRALGLQDLEAVDSDRRADERRQPAARVHLAIAVTPRRHADKVDAVG